MINLDSIRLESINKPARYVGGEVNQVIKNGNVKCSIVLCYPNLYEKAMSNYLINLLYNNINLLDGVWCKRCFAPDMDFEKVLKESNYFIYSLEDFESINKSDILLFVCDNEMDFTNFFNMLDLAGIDIYKEKKSKNSPKIILLPTNNVNIKPIEKFVDYIFNYNSEKESIQRLLKFIDVYNNSDVNIEKTSIDNITNDYEKLDIKHIENSIIPSIKINNSTIIIDFNYMKDENIIIDYIDKSMKARGINTVSFLNYDKISQYKFCEIVYKIKASLKHVRIISKNLDFNKFETNIFDVLLPCMEQSTIFFNVITCSEKLKNKIEIGTEKAKLLEKIDRVFKNNRNSIKLKFNIGLPEETYEDIDDIFSLMEEIVTMYSQNKARDKFSMKVNIDYYIPEEKEKAKNNINNVTKLETKLRYIKEKEYDSIINLDIRSICSYTTRTLLKNGDENISPVIYDAYKLGARYDSDDKKYNENAWEKVLFDNAEIINNYLYSI